MFWGAVNSNSNSNSPHLRKSGSRPAFGEPGNGSNEIKGLTLTTTTAIMMPSPTFLWRFKVLLFFIWGFCCCKIGWHSVMRMSGNVRDVFLYEAFLYYNPLLLVTLMVWLWGINLWVFCEANVNYAKMFDLDQTHLTHTEIWKLSWYAFFICFLLKLVVFVWRHLMRYLDDHHSSNQHDSISLSVFRWRSIISSISTSVLLYIAVVMILISPFDIFYLSSRYYLLRTFWRIVVPLQSPSLTFPSKDGKSLYGEHVKAKLPSLLFWLLAISFSDFFLADILTSMSKVLSDLERSVCRMVHRQVATIAWFEADSVCGSHSVTIPVVLVLPYIFRLFQCLRQYKDSGEKSSLLNALKYSTAVPVIFLSALKYHVFPDKWTNIYRPLWLMSSLLNSMYSFYWDISRDWDMSCFTRIFKFGKPHICSYLLHGRKWVYCWVIGSNLILRCTWTYKLSAHLRHNYLTVFTITALEIFRRFQWVFFRVENEWNKMSTKSHIQLSETDNPTEDDKLLESSNHSV